VPSTLGTGPELSMNPKISLYPMAVSAALACVVFLAASAEATVLLDLSIEELTAGSDLVVTAEVVEQWVQLDEVDGHIRTYTRVQIADVYLLRDGEEAPGLELVIAQEGGFLEDMGTFVAGNADLTVGERALLFLTRGADVYFIFGMELGKYTIVPGQDGIDLVHRPSTVPVIRQGIDGTQLMVERPIVEHEGTTLEALRVTIESVGESVR
jgi:hypothetical protein